MSEQQMFPTDLTTREAQLGFKKAEIENSRNRWGEDAFGEPHLLQVVACPVNESEWFFKVQGPLGVTYRRMRYGLLRKFDVQIKAQPDKSPYTSDLPTWQPIGPSESGMETALEVAVRTPSTMTDVVAMVSPVVATIDGKKYLCHPVGQIPARYVERHNGVEREVGGTTMVCFEVVG
jgi:hypothetical protein